MLSLVLSIGNKIDMEKVVAGLSPVQPVTYVSQLLDILDKRQMKLAMPSIGSRVIPLDIGDLYNCVFYTSKGLYRCQCEIVDRYKEENFYYAIVKQKTDLERYQRREYYRLNCLMNAYARRISKEEEICRWKLKNKIFDDDAEYWNCMAKLDAVVKDWKEIIITDVSGGGAKFNTAIEFMRGEDIFMKMSFSFKDVRYEYELMSRVVDSTSVERKSFDFETRIEFRSITNKERENIIQFIFEEQRKMRQIECSME